MHMQVCQMGFCHFHQMTLLYLIVFNIKLIVVLGPVYWVQNSLWDLFLQHLRGVFPQHLRGVFPQHLRGVLYIIELLPDLFAHLQGC